MEKLNIVSCSNECRLDCTITDSVSPKCITGTVLDCCGNPIHGACVKALTQAYDPLTHTLSNCQGQFTLILETNNHSLLIISKQGYATLVLSSYGEVVHVTLSKEYLGCVVSGKISYNDCHNISPVRVRLINASITKCTYSQPNGVFIIIDVPSGKYTLTIDGNECKEKTIYVTVPESILTLNLGIICVDRINILGTLNGLIKDIHNKPIPNAVVILYNDISKQPIAHTLTNKDGVYFFGQLKIGRYYIDAFY
ncbi:MAG: carboxypeptidase-like regulatory domain-containing protein [Oscillospiraceae bacterium]